MKITVKIFGGSESKLGTIKLVKEYSGLNLKNSKELCDLSWAISKPIELEIDKNDLEKCKKDFNDIGLELKYNDREKKMKRILYSDQAICIKDMLTDVSKWGTLDLTLSKSKRKKY